MTIPWSAAPLRAVDEWAAAPTDGGGFEVTARITVDETEANLRGHFPDFAVYPGVFVLETLTQALGAALAAAGHERPALAEVRSLRFSAPLLAADQLILRITAAPADGGRWKVTAEGRRRDNTVTATCRATYGPGFPVEAGGGHEGEGKPAVLGHAEIRAALPQRYPLLLVDRVLRLEPGAAITTTKAVTGTEPCYAHLGDSAAADRYTYPASLLVESLGQSAALLWLQGAEPAGTPSVLMFVGARDYVFHGAAFPGDTLRHEVRLEQVVADTAFAVGETWVGDRRIASVGSLIAARRPRADLGSTP